MIKALTATGQKNNDALIGFVLFNSRKIAAEYRWLSPKGNGFYGVCQNTLRHLQVDVKTISQEQEDKYYQALKAYLDQQDPVNNNDSKHITADFRASIQQARASTQGVSEHERQDPKHRS